MFHAVFLAVFLSFTLVGVTPSRILFVAPTPLLGHQLFFQPIWRELSLRGHNVTVITTNPLDDRTLTNLTEVDVSYVYEALEKKLNFTEKLISLREDQHKHNRFFVQAMTLVNQEILGNRKVQRLIQWEQSKFDLVMVEYLLPAFLALGVRFKCPTIALSAGDATLAGHDAMGNPSHPVLNPQVREKFGIPLSFAQRLTSVYHAIQERMFSYLLHNYEDAVVERFFSEGYQELSEIATNIDMFFMNVDPVLHNVRPTVPAVVNIGGGIHIRESKPLPKIAILFLLFLASGARGARILFVAPTPAFSHQSMMQPIWRELSLRGHQVTVITPNPLRDPTLKNLTELDMSFIYEGVEKEMNYSEQMVAVKDDPLRFAAFFLYALNWANDQYLSSDEVQKLIKSKDAHFDLAIVELMLPTMMAFAHRFRCPLIAVTTMDASLIAHDAIGNPSHPALNPDILLQFNVPLTFGQRVISVLYSVIRRVGYKFIKDREDKVVAKYFEPGYPSLSEIVNNIDMFFMNVDVALHNIRPTVPAVVHISGIHIKPYRALPEDIQTFLDDAKEGAILFSMGSILKTKSFSPEFITSWLQAFAKLPYKILWKLDEDLPQKSSNILIKDWVPQQDVLRHPNLKLLITPGGIQSVQEAISFRVPLLLIPYCADQFSTSLLVKNKGFGLILDFNSPNKKEIVKTVKELITNPTYKKRVDKVSEISADQPMAPLEKAVWWTEYVLRHKGAKHLRSPAIDLPLYQYFLLDVIGFLALVLGAVVFAFYKLIAGVKCLLCRKAKKQQEKVKKN